MQRKRLVILAVVIAVFLGGAVLIYVNSFAYKAKRLEYNMAQYTTLHTEYKDALPALLATLKPEGSTGYVVYYNYGNTRYDTGLCIEKEERNNQTKIVLVSDAEYLSQTEKNLLFSVMERCHNRITISPNWISIWFSTDAAPFDPSPFIMYSPAATPGLHHEKGKAIDLGDGWYFVIDALIS